MISVSRAAKGRHGEGVVRHSTGVLFPSRTLERATCLVCSRCRILDEIYLAIISSHHNHRRYFFMAREIHSRVTPASHKLHDSSLLHTTIEHSIWVHYRPIHPSQAYLEQSQHTNPGNLPIPHATPPPNSLKTSH